MTTATVNKAAKLVTDDKVQRLPSIGGGVKLWLVHSDRGVYTVTTRGGKARCSCPAGVFGKHCSHGLAALYASGREKGWNTAQ